MDMREDRLDSVCDNEEPMRVRLWARDKHGHHGHVKQCCQLEGNNTILALDNGISGSGVSAK